MNSLDQLLNRIASEHLGLSTLNTRNSDSLDFHNVAVWQVRIALEAAYHAGKASPTDSTARILPTRFDGYEIHGVPEETMEAGNIASRFPMTRLSSGVCTATFPEQDWSVSETSRHGRSPKRFMNESRKNAMPLDEDNPG